MRFFAAALLASIAIAAPASAAIVDFTISASIDGSIGVQADPFAPTVQQTAQFERVRRGFFNRATTLTLTGSYDTDAPTYGGLPFGNTVIGTSVVSAVIDSVSLGTFGSVIINKNAQLRLSQFGLLSLTSTLLPATFEVFPGVVFPNPIGQVAATRIDAVASGLALGALSEPISRTVSLANLDLSNLYGLINGGSSAIFSSTTENYNGDEALFYDTTVGQNGLLRAAGTASAATLTLTVREVVPPGPTVPEPATWTMMIGGFGLVGGAMRRRKASATFA